MKTFIYVMATSALLLAPGSASAQTAPPDRIENSAWITRAIVYPATTPSYTGTALFKTDGTITGMPRDGKSPTVVGSWVKTGFADYTFTFVADVYDASGNFVETDVVTGVMHVNDNGLSATGTSLIEVLLSDGTVAFKQSPLTPSSFTAKRIVAGTLP